MFRYVDILETHFLTADMLRETNYSHQEYVVINSDKVMTFTRSPHPLNRSPILPCSFYFVSDSVLGINHDANNYHGNV